MKILLILSTFFVSWTSSAQTIKEYTITGYIKGLKDGTKLYFLNSTGEDTVTTVTPKQGQFSLQGKIPLEGEPYFIKLDSSVSYEPVTLLLESSNITIHGLIENWPKVEISGSQTHKDYLELLQLISNSRAKMNDISNRNTLFYLQIDSLRRIGDTTEERNIRKKIMTLDIKNKQENERYNKIMIDYAKSHSNSLYVPYLILKLENVLGFDGMQTLYNRLSPKAKSSFLGSELHRTLKTGQIKIGNRAPNFTSRTPDGDTLSLNNVVNRGKLTLLDFWASWCHPCRVQTPQIRKLFYEYHQKGFNVLSVSTDDKPDAWRKAIEKDTMPWFHVSDLRRPGPIEKMYSIYKVPTNYLLDATGKIIAIDLNEENLKKILGDLLKE